MKTCFLLALTFATIVSQATSTLDPLVQRSVYQCGDVSNWNHTLKQDKFVEALTHSGEATTVFMISIQPVDIGIAATGSPAAMTSYILAVGAAGVAVNRGYQATVYFTDSFSKRNLSRLAYELGTDQEGVVTEAFKDSCNEKYPGDCAKVLAVLKAEAKAGTMCSKFE